MKKKSNKLKVLFVGAFQETKDGSLGGQLFACKTLIESNIQNKVDFILLDSTMETLPPPGLFRRTYLAIRRLSIFLYSLTTEPVDTVLIFTSSGLSFLEKGFMIIIANIFSVRTVLSPRSGLILEDLHRSKIMKTFVRFVLTRSDVILCQSSEWKELFKTLTKLPDSRFVVIKNWLNPETYFHIPLKRKEKNKLNVLFLGWIERNKGIYNLIEAVSSDNTLQSNFTYIICGKGSELEEVKKQIDIKNLSKAFDFRGWVYGREKLEILSQSDILVLPSYREGLPNSLLAMASGCSVIATDVGAIPDVIDHRRNGFLIDKSDVKQLIKAILELSSEDLRSQTAKEARETIRSEHDINSQWKKVFNALSFERKI